LAANGRCNHPFEDKVRHVQKEKGLCSSMLCSYLREWLRNNTSLAAPALALGLAWVFGTVGSEVVNLFCT
jgi:hypothetical protein